MRPESTPIDCVHPGLSQDIQLPLAAYFPLLPPTYLPSDVASDYHVITHASNKRCRLIYMGLTGATQDVPACTLGSLVFGEVK
jgi:hypothetical protein